jgi:hypothetical protein
MEKLTNLKNEAAKLALTPAEKSAMKALLRTHYEGQAQPIPSTYFSIFSLRSFSGAGEFVQARVFAPVAVLLVIFVGTGTAAAAQGTLPGDFLYPVKLSINETIEVALASTPVARAEVSSKLAERRVEEAEALSAEGALTPEVGAELAANFDGHVEQVHLLVAEVETQDPARATQLRARLDSSLSAHGAILATLSGGTTENREGTDTVAARVIARTISSASPTVTGALRMAKVAPAAENQAMTMSMMVATDTANADVSTTVSLEADMIDTLPEDSVQEAAALVLQARAEQTMLSARERFNLGKEKLADSTVTQVSGEFAAIADMMQEGSTTLERNDYVQASQYFADAYKRAVTLDVLLKAQAKLERNIITPALEVGSTIDAAIEVGSPVVLPEPLP